MLPLKDTIRSRSFPAVNWLLIIANVSVFVVFELSLPPQRLERFISTHFCSPPASCYNGAHPCPLKIY